MAKAYAGRPQCIMPPNTLKRKMGSGGIDEKALAKAQSNLENNNIDFRPIAFRWLGVLEGALVGVKNGQVKNKAELEIVLFPVAKLKEQGSMFRFPLITEASTVIGDLLETSAKLDKGIMEVLDGYKMAVSAIISNDMTGDGGEKGQELVVSLTAATDRYRNQFAS